MTTATASPAPSSSGARYGVLLGAIIVQLILGTVYGYSIFWEPLNVSVYPVVVTEQKVMTRDAAIDRVVTAKRAAELREQDALPPAAIIVKDQAEADERIASLKAGDPLAGYVLVDTAADVQAALAAARAGNLVQQYKVVPDKDAVAARNDQQKANLKYAFSICILSFALTMVIAGRVQDVKGPRFPAIVGAILMGLGFVVAGFMSTPIVFHIAHAALVGAVAIVLLMLYHALFGKLLKDKYDELGVTCLLRYKGHTPEQNEIEFLKEQFGLER
jgi:hypothetical protein